MSNPSFGSASPITRAAPRAVKSPAATTSVSFVATVHSATTIPLVASTRSA